MAVDGEVQRSAVQSTHSVPACDLRRGCNKVGSGDVPEARRIGLIGSQEHQLVRGFTHSKRRPEEQLGH